MIISTEEDLEVKQKGLFDSDDKLVLQRDVIEKGYIDMVNNEISPVQNQIHTTRVTSVSSDFYSIIESIPESLTKRSKIDFFYLKLLSEDSEEIFLYDDILSESLKRYMGKDSYQIIQNIARENIINLEIKNEDKSILFKNNLSDMKLFLSKESLRETIYNLIRDDKYFDKINKERYIMKEYISDNYVTMCIMCDKRKENCDYFKIFETPPFCICDSCIEEFLKEYLDCSNREIISNLI